MPGLTEIRFFLSHSELRTALATIQYTFQRRNWDRRHPTPFAEHLRDNFQVPGRLIEVDKIEGGAVWRFENAALEIIFLAPDLLRISWEPGLPPIPYALERFQWTPPTAKLTQSQNGFCLESETARLYISADGELTLADSTGKEIRRVDPPRFRLGKTGPTWTDSAALVPDEHLFGLGEHTGKLNLRGRSFTFWNTDPSGRYGPEDDPIYMTLPVYMGIHRSGSYLVFYENPHPGTFTADPPVTNTVSRDDQTHPLPKARISFSNGMLRSYLILGSPSHLLERFTELTGRAPLPPRWSLGYHQSRWGYKTEAEIRSVIEQFHQHDMPLSAIHLDIDYMDGYRVFSFDRSRFPDLEGLTADLAAENIRVVTIVDPAVKCDPAYDVYAQGCAGSYFCFLRGEGEESSRRQFRGVVWAGWSAFPDFTLPETRQWWAGLYPRLLDQGVSGIWHDMNEPSSFSFDENNRLPALVRHHLEGHLGDHSQAHNLYALLMNRAGFEGLQQARPERRPWIVSRSGWVSQQRYAWNWTGDVESTWEALRMTVSTVISCGMSGLPYNGADIGGFSGHPSAELYLRWFQAAALMPYFRTHSSLNVPRREPWSYGEPYTSLIRHALRLRYRLLPYLYSFAWQASQNGAPLVRPIFWADPQDSRLWSIDDAFLVGDALLAAPILEPGCKHRYVTLPAGQWFHFWDDSVYAGFDVVEVECGLEHIPLFVRAGSLLPLETDRGIELHAYLPAEPIPPVESLFYYDADDGYGEFGQITFMLERSDDSVIIQTSHTGNKDLFPKMTIIIHGTLPGEVRIDGLLLDEKTDTLKF